MKQGDYTPDKKATRISGNSNSGERQLSPEPYDVAFYAYQLVMRRLMLISCGKKK
jgi:hypothetical protein